MDISNRLKTLAGMVKKGNIACDVGTDHGYLAIYLVKQGICPHVIAMDVAKGPLGKAQANIELYGMQNHIETRLSDGVAALFKGEASTVIMAGMGGLLINSLLEKGQDILSSMEEIILSPHTDVRLVRQFVLEHGYQIAEETMLVEEEKYYNIFKIHPDKSGYVEDYSECEICYGKLLLQQKHEVLLSYLQYELAKKEDLYRKVMDADTANAKQRGIMLQHEIQIIKEGLQYYEV